MAPELFLQASHSSISVDHLAADMWALGVLTYYTLTKESLFPHRGALFRYEEQPDAHFPNNTLKGRGVSAEGQAFLQALLRPKPSERPHSGEATRQPWVQSCMPTEPVIWGAQSESVK